MKNWDMVKFILAASVILSFAGMGLYMYQNYDLNRMKSEKQQSKRLLSDIGKASAEVELRRNELMNDRRQGERLNDYLQKQAHAAQINYNRDINLKVNSENKNPSQGFVDFPVELKPSGKQQFSRLQLAQYIFNIENFTNRLKVTEIYVDKPTPDRERWDMYMILTERAPLEKQ